MLIMLGPKAPFARMDRSYKNKKNKKFSSRKTITITTSTRIDCNYTTRMKTYIQVVFYNSILLADP